MSTGDVMDWSKASGPRLYETGKQLIPGGTQLLSKDPARFLPGQWPAYYSHAKGCDVWDLDGRRFIDMSTMGIGSCTLGYADDDVNKAVKQAIDAGSMSTLNAPEEVELAQQLCEIHPWAAMARYARTGGESMAIAIRIARTYTGREILAICGYHGWSDWYLAANLGEKDALDGHLMPGLSPTGVPRALQGTAITFRYNQIEQLEQIAKTHGSKLAAIVMEPVRYDEPADGFLNRVRGIADRIGAVLVFDEISSGWRFCLGGMHMRYGVEPDIAVFAKAISNGYPMGAVIGKEDVMQAAQNSFISSTYWTERIGPTAALATIAKMRSIKLSTLTQRAGQKVHDGWTRLAAKHGINISIHGLKAFGGMQLNYGDQSLALGTLLTQEMLDRGFLANLAFYAAAPHTDAVIDQYLSALDEVFAVLAQAIERGDLTRRLRGPVATSGFARLT